MSADLTDAERKSLTDGIMADDRLGGDRSTFRAVARIKADAIATARAEERARWAPDDEEPEDRGNVVEVWTRGYVQGRTEERTRLTVAVESATGSMRSAVEVGCDCYQVEGWHALSFRLLIALMVALDPEAADQ